MVFLALILLGNGSQSDPDKPFSRILTCQVDEEVGDVLNVGRITCCIMVHLVCFSRLILRNVEQDVNSCV